MGRRGDDYRFLQLTDAIASINQKVNLIGVVIETSIPKQSKGTDCFCTIRILDESKPSPGIPINFFAETMEKLPQVMAAGDIILLSHVVENMVEASFHINFLQHTMLENKTRDSYWNYVSG